MVGSASAETLNQWLTEQVQRDEQLLVDALAQTGGHSLELLKDCRSFVNVPKERRSLLRNRRMHLML
ncbi:MAG: hypothetical protein B7Z37_30715 [Verrucomicrobia bacterium 12-59-8]|nr:MAG: hypothetical protein B7Z37_30715 [Verrucomicrobia bacterium 12-59-8]